STTTAGTSCAAAPRAPPARAAASSAMARKPRTGRADARPASGAGGREGTEGEVLAVGCDVHFDLVAPAELPEHDLLAEGILDVPLDGTLERPRAIVLVVALVHEERRGRRREPDLVAEPPLDLLEEDLDDLGDVLAAER